MPHFSDSGFSAPTEKYEASALLFDMDGTIIDSTNAIIRNWQQLGKAIGVDSEYLLQTSHGRRMIDVLALHAPHLANWNFVREVEGRIPLEFGNDAVEVPGSRTLLEALEIAGAPWTVVTSGTRPLVTGWLAVMNLACPAHLITAEDVSMGKPDPTGFRQGARRLGHAATTPSKIVVFEDSPAGISAGKAAGYKVIALATTHDIGQLRLANPDLIVEDLRSVVLTRYEKGSILLEIHDPLVPRTER